MRAPPRRGRGALLRRRRSPRRRDLAPAHRRGEAISLISLSLYLGLAIGPLIGEALLGDRGYRRRLARAAGVIALASVGLSWLAPETLPPRRSASDRRRAASTAPPSGAGSSRACSLLCGVWGMGPFFAFLPLLADERGSAAPGTFFGVFAIVVVVPALFGARLPDRIGAARLSGTALVVSAVGHGDRRASRRRSVGPAGRHGRLRVRRRVHVPGDHRDGGDRRAARRARHRRRHGGAVRRRRVRAVAGRARPARARRPATRRRSSSRPSSPASAAAWLLDPPTRPAVGAGRPPDAR